MGVRGRSRLSRREGEEKTREKGITQGTTIFFRKYDTIRFNIHVTFKAFGKQGRDNTLKEYLCNYFSFYSKD